MISMFVLISILVWMFGPIIYDLLGYKQKDNLDVYKAYIELLRIRSYAKVFKNCG